MLVALASLIAIAYLPGAFIFRFPAADRPRRAALAADERAFWAIVISVAITTLVALALAAAGAYTFPRLVAIDVAISAVLLLAGRERLRFTPPAAARAWTALTPLALVALGLYLYFPSSEYVMGGKDPGTYMNEGIQIAQRGSLITVDSTLAEVPDEFRDLFLSGGPAEVKEELHQGVRFMGFFVVDRSRGEVIGQFPHAFPAWIAIGYGVDGLTGARRAVGAWAILGLLAVYFAAARLVGRLTAGAGCVLLAINIVEVWYARYPNSEVMQQALLFAGLLALARAAGDTDRFFGPVAGMLLGTLLFARMDSVVVLAAIAGGFVLLVVDGKRLPWTFFAPLAALLGLAAAYYLGPMKAYSATLLYQTRGYQGLLAGVAGVCAAAVLARVLTIRAPEVAAAVRRLLPPFLVLAMLAAAVYSYFFRMPAEHTRDYAAQLVVRPGLAVHDAAALRMYAWYVGATGLAAAVIGFSLVTWRSFWRDPVLLSSTAALALFVFYKVRIVPEHFWMVRRYLPLILPMTCIFIACAAFVGFEWWRRSPRDPSAASRGRWHTAMRAARHLALPLVLLAFLGSQYAGATRAIAHHVEYAGLIPQLEALAGRFGDRDLVIVEPRNSSDAHVLATPLAYIYARHVLLVSSPRPNRDQFERFLAWAWTAYRRVYLVAEGGLDIASPAISVVPVTTQAFGIAEYESAVNAYPKTIREKKFRLNIYTLDRATRVVPVTDVDVGGYDDVWVLRMFAREQGEGASYRWVRNMSFVSLLGIDPSVRSVVLRMSNGGRPARAGEARVTVFLNDERLGEVTVGPGFSEYRVPIPAEVAGPAGRRIAPSVLRLMCTTWMPKSVLGGTDDRQLGVMLDRVRVE
jgi:hypothetical protein